MSDRDVIAAHMPSGIQYCDIYDEHEWYCMAGDGTTTDRLTYAAHVVAALRESRTVRTVEQLDALPDGTIILDDAGDPLTRRGSRWWSIDHHDEDREVEIGQWSSLAVFTPGQCLILWNPDEDGAL